MDLGLALVKALGAGLSTYGEGKKLTDARRDQLRQRNNELEMKTEQDAREAEYQQIKDRQALAERNKEFDYKVDKGRSDAEFEGVKYRREKADKAAATEAQHQWDMSIHPDARYTLMAQGKLKPVSHEDAVQFGYWQDKNEKAAQPAAEKTDKEIKPDWADQKIADNWMKMDPEDQAAEPGGFQGYRTRHRKAFGLPTDTPFLPGPSAPEPSAADEANAAAAEKPLSTGHQGIDVYNAATAPKKKRKQFRDGSTAELNPRTGVWEVIK